MQKRKEQGWRPSVKAVLEMAGEHKDSLFPSLKVLSLRQELGFSSRENYMSSLPEFLRGIR